MTQSTAAKIYSLLASARSLDTLEITKGIGGSTRSDLRDTLKALDKLYQEGKVKKIYAAGNWTHWSRPDVGRIEP